MSSTFLTMDSLTINAKFKFNFSSFFSCLIITWFSTYSNASQECKFPAIFNFGDSNSDTGILASVVPLLKPYGTTFFGKPSGRFSDGRLIIDFIANNLSLPFVNPYLGPNGNYTAGANFAVAGASILPSLTSPSNLPLEYQQFTQLISNKGDVLGNETFSEALYSIDIGQNDIGNAFLLGKTTNQVKAMVPTLVNATVLLVKKLYGMGARSFWIHNTGPVGCLAYILDPLSPSADQIDEAGCGIPYNNVAQFFNSKLNDSISTLKLDLPLAAITYVDIYTIKYSLFTQPQKYGFSKPLIVCCGTGMSYNFNSFIRCGLAESCSNPAIKVNWDGVHYTEAANKVVYDLLLTTTFSDPPIAPIQACNRFF